MELSDILRVSLLCKMHVFPGWPEDGIGFQVPCLKPAAHRDCLLSHGGGLLGPHGTHAIVCGTLSPRHLHGLDRAVLEDSRDDIIRVVSAEFGM